MEKIKNAISNDVFRDGNKIIKNYKITNFNKAFGNQEDVGLLNSGISFTSGPGKIELDYIEHRPWKHNSSLTENIEFIKWLKNFHDTTTDQGLHWPNFRDAYYHVLNVPQGKFRKKRQFLPLEEGFVIDALNLLTSGKQVLLHNDLVDGNILIVDGTYKLIDFEYCGHGNPIFDIASFVTEREISLDDAAKIAKTYDPKINMDDFWIVCAFLHVFWMRWAEYNFMVTQKDIFHTIAKWKLRKYNELIRR